LLLFYLSCHSVCSLVLARVWMSDVFTVVSPAWSWNKNPEIDPSFASTTARSFPWIPTWDPHQGYIIQRFIDAHLHIVVYPWHKCHQVVELRKKVRPPYQHQPTLTDSLLFRKAVLIVPDSKELFEFHHEQIVRLNQSQNQEPLV
jgi:hypothetical protein